MENSTVTFWGDWRKTSGANVQRSGATTPSPCIMTSSSSCHSCGRVFGFYADNSRPPPSLLARPHHPWFFSTAEDEIEVQGATFWQHWRDPARIAGHDEDADAKWLPAVLPIMEIPLGSLYQCRRGLLQRWSRQTEISVSGTSEEFRELLSSTTYCAMKGTTVADHGNCSQPLNVKCCVINKA